ALHAHARAVAHSGGNLDRELLALLDRAGAAAARAGAHPRPAPAAALRAGRRPTDADGRLRAPQRIEEIHLDGVLEVGAASRPRRGAGGDARPEQLLADVGEATLLVVRLLRGAPPTPPAGAAEAEALERTLAAEGEGAPALGPALVLACPGGSDLAQRGDDLLVVRLDQRTRPLEQLLRPAGGHQDELEAVGNALQAILDRDACHRLKEPPRATTNGNPARRESLDLPRGGRYEPPAHGAPVAPARDRGRRARPARGPDRRLPRRGRAGGAAPRARRARALPAGGERAAWSGRDGGPPRGTAAHAPPRPRRPAAGGGAGGWPPR